MADGRHSIYVAQRRCMAHPELYFLDDQGHPPWFPRAPDTSAPPAALGNPSIVDLLKPGYAWWIDASVLPCRSSTCAVDHFPVSKLLGGPEEADSDQRALGQSRGSFCGAQE